MTEITTEITQELLRTMQKRAPFAPEVAKGTVKGTVKGTDLQVMRESNRLLILNYVREHGPVARATIARATGLSATTVSTIIDALLQEGFVLEGATQRAAASGGRRVVPVYFNAAGGYIFGIALGRNYLTMLLCDLSAAIVSRNVIPFDTRQGAEVCLPLLVTALRVFAKAQGVSWNRIVGAGLGMPGPIDPHLQGPISPPRMPGWHNVNVRDLLSHSLGMPVYLDNNANLGALGESRYGAGQGVSNMIYLQLGAGIGGGLIMDGKIYRGNMGSAGEVGHMTVEPRGPICSCGKRGCLEVLAGAHAIVEEARQKRSHFLADESADETVSAPNRLSELANIGQVVHAAQAGDPACREALESAGTSIGIALANLMNVLNPSLILLDGSSMQAGKLLLEPILQAVTSYSLPELCENTRIISGALGGDATALGGIAVVLDAIFGAGLAPQFSSSNFLAG
ncbi:MAG: ROK family transcriptional regulator [Ktedonobacteraceae bacterium]|nr:ROK family transcriptional regulator [Ktedonobacteraceae bacterium]